MTNGEYPKVAGTPDGKCGARSKTSGKRCGRAPMANGRCYLHGGKSLGGPASPTYKHGRYSKYIPKSLLGDYEEILKDPELTGLRDELGILTLRMARLLDGLDDNSPPWEEVQEKWKQALRVFQEGNVLVADALLKGLDNVIDQGVAAAERQRATWKELREIVQEKTRTAAAEWFRLRDLRGLVQLDKVMGMWRGVLEAIRLNVSDPAVLRAVTADVLRFMPPPSSGGGVIDVAATATSEAVGDAGPVALPAG